MKYVVCIYIVYEIENKRIRFVFLIIYIDTRDDHFYKVAMIQ